MTVELPPVELDSTPEQESLGETLRSFFGAQGSRRAVDTELGAVRDRLKALGTQLGVLGIDVPANLGGPGASLADAVILDIEAGRSLCSVPLISLAAATTILVAANDNLLPAVLAGDVLIDIVGIRPDGRPSARSGSQGVVVEGSCPVVLGGDADFTFVIADSPDGLLVAVTDPGVSGASVQAAESLDLSRRWSRQSFDSVSARVLIPATQHARIQASIDRAMIAAAADQVGICLYMVDTAIAYAKIRYQFGRAIGSQQAIKHRLVDMSLWAERASAALDYAARNSAHETGHLSSLAALECCTRAAVEVTTSAIQVLGGIGMTWEHPAHLYLRRALGNQALFGSSRLIRHEIAEVLWPRQTQPGGLTAVTQSVSQTH